MSPAFRALGALVLLSLPLLPAGLRAEVHLVEIAGGAFVPIALTVAAGDTLRVVNRDGVPHTLTADDGSYDSGRLMDGDATQIVLTAVGTHGFRCTLGGQRVELLLLLREFGQVLPVHVRLLRRLAEVAADAVLVGRDPRDPHPRSARGGARLAGAAHLPMRRGRDVPGPRAPR